MRRVLLFGLCLGLTGCATSEPIFAPWLMAETLSKREVEGFEKIMAASKQKGCVVTDGVLTVHGQSGKWKSIACYGMDQNAEASYLEALKLR